MPNPVQIVAKPTKKRNLFKVLGICAIVFIVVVIGGGVLLFTALSGGLKKDFDASVGQFEAICAKLNKSDISSAYSLTDSSFQTQYSKTSFNSTIGEPLSECKSFKLADPLQAISSTKNGVTQNYYIGEITFKDNTSNIKGRISFVKRGDGWKFIGISNKTNLDDLN